MKVNASKVKLKKVLVIQLRQLGDILLTTPILKSLKEFDPEMEIHFLSHKMGKLVLQNNPFIQKHIFYEDSGYSTLNDIRTILELRKENYDLVLDFMSNPRSALWTYWINPKHSIGLDVGIRAACFKSTVARRLNESRYIVEEKHDFLKQIDIPMTTKLPLYFTKPEEDEWARKYFESAPYKDFHWKFILSPTHRRVARQWPKSSYAKLCEKLLDQYPKSAVFWLWGPGEKEFVEDIHRQVQLHKDRSWVLEQTSFSQMASLIKQATYFIANSNGPSHVAVALGTPSLQIHGPTRGSAWCPNDGRHIYIQSENSDISSIHMKDVFLKVEKHLSEIFQT